MRTAEFLADEDLSANDSELHLGMGSLLGVFFGLTLVCGVFFGFGYTLGLKAVQSPAPQAASAPSVPSITVKPAAGSVAEQSSAEPPAVQVVPRADSSTSPSSTTSSERSVGKRVRARCRSYRLDIPRSAARS